MPGAILTGGAASHVRVGAFQYLAARQEVEGLGVLAQYVIERHYPELAGAEKPYRALLAGVVGRQARLVAQWMLLGFIHGVMNTDNMAVSGETIDYGPCAFMEAYEPGKVYSSIDQQGRYAYSNQPHAAHWNLTRLAEAMLPLLAEEEGGEEAAVTAAQEVLGDFAREYEAARLAGMRRKLGLMTAQDGDEALGEDLLARMAVGRADFTLTFRLLGTPRARDLFADPASYDSWETVWRARLAQEDGEGREETMRLANPAHIPRNHLVEEVIQVGLAGDYGQFADLIEVGLRPYEEQAGRERFRAAARPEQCVSATFCGT